MNRQASPLSQAFGGVEPPVSAEPCPPMVRDVASCPRPRRPATAARPRPPAIPPGIREASAPHRVNNTHEEVSVAGLRTEAAPGRPRPPRPRPRPPAAAAPRPAPRGGTTRRAPSARGGRESALWGALPQPRAGPPRRSAARILAGPPSVSGGPPARALRTVRPSSPPPPPAERRIHAGPERSVDAGPERGPAQAQIRPRSGPDEARGGRSQGFPSPRRAGPPRCGFRNLPPGPGGGRG